MTSFTPSDINGMQLWFDANDPTCYTLSTGTTITQLNDKSGNGNNTTSIRNISGGIPTIQSNIINKLPVFNLFNCGFLGNLSAGSQNNGTTSSFCIVVMFTSLTSNRRVIAFGNNDTINDGNSFLKYNLSPINSTISLNRIGFNTVTPVSISLNTPYLITGYFNGTKQYLGVNGVYNCVDNIYPNNFNIINYGFGINTYSSISPEAGQIKCGELIVYNNALSTLNMQRIEGYLATKWGLNPSLPINHPFRYSSIAYNTPIPPNISGLQLWFDASDRNSYTLSSGTNILNLNDKSPNANTAVSYYGTQPTLQTNIINTLPVFNMENGAFGGSFYTPNTGSSVSFCMILTITSYTGLTTNAPVILSLGNFGTNSGTVPLVIENQQLQLKLNSGNVVSPVTISLNTPYLVTCYINNTTQYLGVNGIYASTSNTNVNQNIYNYGIGYNTNTSEEIGNYKYGEILVFNNQLSNISLQQLEGYLAWKWGINTSLPNTHPYYIYAPPLIVGTSVTSNFVPTNIQGVQLWLDALDYSTLNFDIINNIYQWNDKSGYSRNANYYGSVSFISQNSFNVLLNVGYNPYGFNNLPAITYDFTSTNRGLKSLMPAGTLSEGCTLFVVFQSSSLSNSTLLCRDVAGPSGGPFMIHGVSRFIGSVSGNSTYNIGTTSTTATIYSCTITNTSIWNDYINGTISLSRYIASTYNDTSTYIGIGLRNDYATWFKGSMSEILVYNQALPNQSRQLVEGYLAWKWNLVSSLPSTHPYKLGMPSNIPYSGITTPIPTWLQYYSSANKLLQSYINGFLDISGNLIVRGNPTTLLGGDLVTNGNVYMNTGSLITGGNIIVSNIFGLSSGITTNTLTVNSDASLSNMVVSTFTNLTNLSISGNVIFSNGLKNVTPDTINIFYPSIPSGLQLWFDASDKTSYTLSGNKISQIKDKSGNGNNTTSYSGVQPTLQENIINNNPVFNLAYGAFLGNFSTANTGTSLSIFMIATITDFFGSGGGWITLVLGLGNGGGTNIDNQQKCGIYTYGPTSSIRLGRNGGPTFYPSLNVPYLITAYFDGTNGYFSLNATYSSFVSTGNFNITNYGLGVNSDNGTFPVGSKKFGEVLVYNNALSISDRQKVEGYLAWKWGTYSSLPTNHPYYSFPPPSSQTAFNKTRIGKNITNNGGIGTGSLTMSDNFKNTAIINGVPFPGTNNGNCNVAFANSVLNNYNNGAYVYNNTAVGYSNVSTSFANSITTVGTNSAQGNMNGYNTSIGYNANTVGTYNTCIGAQASTSNANMGCTNSTVIGYNGYCTTNNTITLGTTSDTVYIPGRLTIGTISTTTTPKLTVYNDAYALSSSYINTKGNIFINITNSNFYATSLNSRLTTINNGFIINATYDGNFISGSPGGTGAGLFSINGLPQGTPYNSNLRIYYPFYIYKVYASCKTVPTGTPTIQLYNGSSALCSVTFASGTTTVNQSFNTLINNITCTVMFSTSVSTGGTFWKVSYFCKWY